MVLGLTGRRAVVTGGSKGIGLEVAKELVREGAFVVICARNYSESPAPQRSCACLAPGFTTRWWT